MLMQTNPRRIRSNEDGMAAIIITIVMMMVVSLIVLGFAQITRREQRQTLDRQLATQAYYAAESGIHLAQSKIKQLLQNGEAIPAKLGCGAASFGSVPITAADLQVGNAEITCLLVNTQLTSLNYHDVGLEGIVSNVESQSGSTDEITFSWQNASDGSDPSGCNMAIGTFPPDTAAGNWTCNQPLLRVDLVPLNGGGPGSVTQGGLAGSQFTTFFYPQAGGGSAAYSPGSVDSITAASCTAGGTPYKCTGRITGLGGQSYGVRVLAIYGSASLSISAQDGGAPATLVNGQTVIDATAKANDVLRRIQVSVSTSGSSPDFGLVSGGGLCKRYAVSAVVSIDGDYPDCVIN